MVLILRHLFPSVHRPVHCFHSLKVTCLAFCTGVNGDELTDCTISGSSATVSVQVKHEGVDNRNISGRDNNRAASPVPQDVSRTVTLGTNNYSTGSNTAFIELSTSSSHQLSPTEHCVNICCEADQTCNRSIALALTPTTTTSNKMAATGCVQSQEEEETCAGGGCRGGGDGSCEQSDVTNCKLQLGTNGATDKVVGHLEEVVHGESGDNGNGSLKQLSHSFKSRDSTDLSEKSEVTKKLLGCNSRTDKVVDHSDNSSKRFSALSRMAYHEHTLESMRPDSPLSASMSLLSTDTGSLHNNDDIDSPRHDTQIHMEVSSHLREEEDYCSDSSQNEMTPDDLSICSSDSDSTVGSMHNGIAETRFSNVSIIRDKKLYHQNQQQQHERSQHEGQEMDCIPDTHQMHQKISGGVPSGVGLECGKGNEEESSFTDFSNRGAYSDGSRSSSVKSSKCLQEDYSATGLSHSDSSSKWKVGNSLCCTKCGQSFQTVSTQNVNNEHVARCRSCGQYVPNGDSSSNISKAQSNKINFPPPPKKRDLLWNKDPMSDHDQKGNGNTHHIIPEIIVRNSNTDTSPGPDGTVHAVIDMDLAVERPSSLPNGTPKSVSRTYLSYTYYLLQTKLGAR